MSSPQSCPCELVLLDLSLLYYFLHFLTSLISFLNFVKFVVNLFCPTRVWTPPSTSNASLSLSTRRLVCQSPSSMPDRTGRPVGDRPHRNPEAQIRTLLDLQKEQLLAQCQTRVNQHEFQAARAAEVQQRDQQLLQRQVQQNLESR